VEGDLELYIKVRVCFDRKKSEEKKRTKSEVFDLNERLLKLRKK